MDNGQKWVTRVKEIPTVTCRILVASLHCIFSLRIFHSPAGLPSHRRLTLKLCSISYLNYLLLWFWIVFFSVYEYRRDDHRSHYTPSTCLVIIRLTFARSHLCSSAVFPPTFPQQISADWQTRSVRILFAFLSQRSNFSLFKIHCFPLSIEFFNDNVTSFYISLLHSLQSRFSII